MRAIPWKLPCYGLLDRSPTAIERGAHEGERASSSWADAPHDVRGATHVTCRGATHLGEDRRHRHRGARRPWTLVPSREVPRGFSSEPSPRIAAEGGTPRARRPPRGAPSWRRRPCLALLHPRQHRGPRAPQRGERPRRDRRPRSRRRTDGALSPQVRPAAGDRREVDDAHARLRLFQRARPARRALAQLLEGGASSIAGTASRSPPR